MSPIQYQSDYAANVPQQEQQANGATSILLFSVLLRAIVYIRSDGELRVTTRLSNDTVTASRAFSRVCKEGDEAHSMCTYAAVKGDYVLAMSSETGFLTTVHRSHVSAEVGFKGLCTQFLETVEPSSDIVQLMGCADRQKQWPVVMSGRPVQDMDVCKNGVDPFVQTSRFEETSTEARRFSLAAPSDYLAGPQANANACAELVRDSYPLLWSGPNSQC